MIIQWYILLYRLSRGGVNCPEVVLLRKHVLVMSFIGTDHNPAPTLKEAKLTPSQLESAYDQCIKVSRRHLSITCYTLCVFRG